jgi:hypothetical protein
MPPTFAASATSGLWLQKRDTSFYFMSSLLDEPISLFIHNRSKVSRVTAYRAWLALLL